MLALEDGSVFNGRSIGVAGQAVGEVVFNTAMTGYQEILTDPSYARQIVTLTYPHIGNTGANSEDMESARVYAAGLVIRDLPSVMSNWRAEHDLPTFLGKRQVVAIAAGVACRVARALVESPAAKQVRIEGDRAADDRKLAAVFPILFEKIRGACAVERDE